MSTDDNRTTQDAQSELADRLQDTAWMAQRIEVLESQVEGRSREIERLAALASSWQATAQRLAEAGDAADHRVIELEALISDLIGNPMFTDELEPDGFCWQCKRQNASEPHEAHCLVGRLQSALNRAE